MGGCSPPQLIGCLLPVVQEFRFKDSTGVHLGHEVVQLVIVGDSDPMVFTLDLAPIQLARKGGAPWRKEVVFDSHILLVGNNIPRVELGNQCFDRLVFVPYIVLLKFLDIFCVDGCDDGFDRHQVDQLLEGVLLPLNLWSCWNWVSLCPLVLSLFLGLRSSVFLDACSRDCCSRRRVAYCIF